MHPMMGKIKKETTKQNILHFLHLLKYCFSASAGRAIPRQNRNEGDNKAEKTTKDNKRKQENTKQVYKGSGERHIDTDKCPAASANTQMKDHSN